MLFIAIIVLVLVVVVVVVVVVLVLGLVVVVVVMVIIVMVIVIRSLLQQLCPGGGYCYVKTPCNRYGILTTESLDVRERQPETITGCLLFVAGYHNHYDNNGHGCDGPVMVALLF